ncbi:MAG TPA: PRD domain-containing protein [Candidatus Blautia avistercoris]|uniref:BglG family transcription antiterminator LicT n=1 Tax=Blautia sp. An249 TaxID=1965603 RepID=UPI000B3793DA|nr:PRD domain-containing protein [Blautia sp. An249]OUO81401.1 transcription antiterminator LicT [Blautia sp. An249]HIY19474.1 PRD domain-containing protein [Candidatus Blautia avistercoris]
MKIIRVLNTNAVVSVDGENREVIITGPGIGFKKKKGEHLDESLIDKTYCLQSKESSHRLQEVVKAISEQYLEIAARVVRAARTEQGLKVNDILYVTLTDHIHSAVERYRAGIQLKNIIKMDIRKFYSKEYAVGKQAIQWIYEESGIDLGEDEAAFIAMHIVASELENNEVSDVKKITELITSIVQIVRIHFKVSFHEDSVSYQRFITHLKFFSARVFDHTAYQDSMEEIYEVMVKQNEYAYTGVEKVAQFIEKQYQYSLSIDERLYLLIHIKRILDEQKND